MSTPARTLAPPSANETTPTSLAANRRLIDDEVGPSRTMEIGLHALVTSLLMVSIIGIAFVYGFNLDSGSLLDNISAAVRALGVDGGFFLGLYFSRRLWMRRKSGWWDGIKTTIFGMIWFLVALLMAALSWFSNTLFVTNFQTIITQDLLARAGFTSISPQLVNKAIGAIPLVIVLLYSIVPRRVQVRLDQRTAEEIEEEARREAARIRAQNLVAAARAEGAGQRIRTVLGGLVNEAFNLEEAKKRDELLKQMRIALETAGYSTADLNDEQVEIQAVARGVWDPTENSPVKVAPSSGLKTHTYPRPTVTRQPATKHEMLSIDALNEQELEVWQPVEQKWGKATVRPESEEAIGFTLGELATALHVAHGTITYWTRPEFSGPTKIFEHEIATGPDGIQRVGPEVLARLLRASNKVGQIKANGFLPTTQGAMPTLAATLKNGSNHHFSASEDSNND
jgi:hypothetical protein